MTNHENRRNYRLAFTLALILCIVLAATVGVMWQRLHSSEIRMKAQSATAAAAPIEANSSAISEPPAQSGSQAEVPLAPIQLSPQKMQSIGIKLGSVEAKSLNDEIRTYGNVQVDERKTAYVQTRFPGWIRTVYADATGDLIRKGQPLFTIYSPDLVAAQEEYLLAKSNASRWRQSSISGVAAGATSLLEAARSRLSQWDISSSDLAKMDETDKPVNDLTIYSPATGYVTERNALPNVYVQPETKLYVLADLSQVWIYAQVFQSDSAKIRPGNPVEVTTDAYPGKIFRGQVDYILPQVDMTTRTIPVRMVFENQDVQLRPGMYVNVDLKLPQPKQIVVPASAVFHSGIRNLVFVYVGNGSIEPREIEPGNQVGDDVPVRNGLKQGEQVVTSANFLIDSEAQLQAAAGAFMPPPPGAGAAASMNSPVTQAKIEMTTDPSPPHKGNNTVRVRLTASDGTAIGGADVTATFFMAEMPAMGMAAMRTVVNAADQGGGMYTGSGDLGSAGTWQVTITAKKNGQILANQQSSVNATGGR